MLNLEYITDLNEFLQEKEKFLKSFIGRKLNESWIVWDLEDNEWFKDCPVVLVFDDIQLIFCTNKLEELSVTEGTINFENKPIIDWAEFDLEWRKDAIPELGNCVGLTLENIYVLEYEFSTTIIESKEQPNLEGSTKGEWLLNGLEFKFIDGFISLFNALDENGISSKKEDTSDLRRYQVT